MVTNNSCNYAPVQHDLLIGGANGAITSVAPSATSGVAVISQGASVDPAFGTVVVAGGGTGATSLTGVLTGNGTSAVTANAVTNHAVVIGGASNAVSSVGPGTSGQILQSGGASVNPAYTTATYPATTTINQILYSSAANTIGGITTANTALLNTNSSGVPSLSTSPTVSASGNPTLKVYGTTASTNNGGVILLANDCTTANFGGCFIACNIGGSLTSDATFYIQQRTNANAFVGGMLTYNYTNQNWQFFNSNAVSLQINSAGQQYNTLQCAFLYYLGANVTNAIGNLGTTYTMGTNALTKVFDQNNNMTTGGTFTAPVTGRYRFTFQIAITNCTILTTLVSNIVTTARQYRRETGRGASSVDMGLSHSALCDMTAADTATFNIAGIGEAAATDTIVGTTTPYTFICGELVT